MALAASVFRRGGQKKELCGSGGVPTPATRGSAGNDDADDAEEEEVVSLAELTEVLSLPRAG
jgi:hypothetical protein